MSSVCTRCDNTGWLNIEQLPDNIDGYNYEIVSEWVHNNENHDITECDCCGDCEVPGEHGINDNPVFNCM